MYGLEKIYHTIADVPRLRFQLTREHYTFPYLHSTIVTALYPKLPIFTQRPSSEMRKSLRNTSSHRSSKHTPHLNTPRSAHKPDDTSSLHSSPTPH